MKKFLFVVQIFCAISMVLSAQKTPHSHALGTSLQFPNILGYQTLKCDFHQHTVFSDGEVWPSIRVREALMDNLDVISLTEHLEYQPHLGDIPHKDRNRSYQIAVKEAKNQTAFVFWNHPYETSKNDNISFLYEANQKLIGITQLV